jgi:hypothetical protein
MKKLLLISFTLHCFFLAQSTYCQVDPTCEVIFTEEPEKRIRPYIGNNSFLLKVLEEHQIYLPDDYLEKLDEQGKYLGMDLNLKDLRLPKDVRGKGQIPGESERMAFPGHTIYYLPVVIWNHANSAGQRLFLMKRYMNILIMPLRFSGRMLDQLSFT